MRMLIRARNCEIAIEADRIVEPGGGCDLVLEFPDAEVAPGLINSHDHLHRNHYGRLGRPPYVSAYDWAADIQAREADCIARGRRLKRRDALLGGAWKNLLCGVTTVVHHDAWELDFNDGFPVKVAKVSSADSLGMTPDLEGLGDHGPYCLHVAEGSDARAAGETQALDERGLLTSDLIAVHGVGMDADAIERFRRSGAALVWCPSSNQFLFGRTASETLLADGVDLLIGSDSRLTADGDLLDEVRHARSLGFVDDQRLMDGLGAVAARRLGLPLPSLEIGSAADVVVLAKPVLEARADDVLLVLVDGVPRVAEPSVGQVLGCLVDRAEVRPLGTVSRWTSDAPLRKEALQ